MKKLFYVFFLVILTGSLVADEYTYTAPTVRSAMQELFTYHIDKHEMNPLIVRRSFISYLNSFDIWKTYLTRSEVDAYMQPSDQLVQSVLEGYQRDDYLSYRQLNDLVVSSINRSRAIYAEWLAAPEQLTRELKQYSIGSFEPQKEYAKNLDELKARMKERLLLFITLKGERDQLDLSNPEIVGKVAQLYLKRLEYAEEEYLPVSQGALAQKQESEFYLRVIKSMAQSLDAHTEFYSPSEAYGLRVQLEKGFCGIGIVLDEGINGITIARLIQGGPAFQSGLLKERDTIISIDGQNIEGTSFGRVLEMLRGDNGTKISLGLRRHAEGKEEQLAVTLTRSAVVLNDSRVDVSYYTLDDQTGIIGVIALDSFYEGESGISSDKDVLAAIRQLEKVGPLKGLVFDLRNNLGGFLLQAVKVTGLFITDGVVVRSKVSDGSEQVLRDVEGVCYYQGPMVVLTSRESASAAEIVAQALQDYGVALVVGDEQTYGKGSIQHQTVTDPNAEYYYKVTIGRYYTVSGRSTQISGVEADILVPTENYYQKIGERYLDYPLAGDRISPAYEDDLHDVRPETRPWFQRFYLPHLQQRVAKWRNMLPQLKERSAARISSDIDYQHYMQAVREGTGALPQEGAKNRQPLVESIRIVKDMIQLDAANREPQTQEAALVEN